MAIIRPASRLVAQAATVAGSVSPFPLEVSGKRLLDAHGGPFFICGDTAWSMFVQLSDAETDQYLDDRQSRGVNTVLANLIEKNFGDDAPNMAGAASLAPFDTPNDIRAPNDDYFDRVVTIVEDLLSRNMLAMLAPAYIGFELGAEGWWTQLAARTTGECEDYGEYVGTKFAHLPNILWLMGGDAYDPSVESRINAIVTGMKATGRADWLFSYHAAPGSSSADVWDGATWLDVNAVYDQTSANIPGAAAASWAEATTRPGFLLEGRYENEPDPAISRALLRAQNWWAALGGASAGVIFGNNPIWNFEAPNALFPYPGTWADNLSSNGSQDFEDFIAIWLSYPWHTLEPDTTDTLLTGGEETGTSRAVAAFAADGSLAMVYTPSQKALTIDHTHFSGDMDAKWVNPTTRAETAIGAVSNTGSDDYTPPSSGDWLLVFEEAA